MKVTADPGTRQEIMNYFSFRPDGYQFSPKFKARVWDGYFRLYQPMRPFLYVGLLPYLQKFCNERGYELVVPAEIAEPENIDDDYGYEIAKEIGCKFEPRDYQNEYIVNALRNRRSLSLSPTSSGKSLIIHLIQQHYYETLGLRTLIIVPTISLVHQMAGDFVDYGCDAAQIYKIQGGVDKNNTTLVEIEMENRKTVSLRGNELVEIINSGKITKKLAKDLTENDEINDRWIQKQKSK
jgi:hypothetical protein